MPDIDANLPIDVTGNTASIATDYSTSGVTNAHVQIVKLAWGDTNTSQRVTTGYPLPVDIRTITATVGVTGSVGGLGHFKVINGVSGATGPTIPLIVAGTTSTSYTPVQINGYVQGVTNGIGIGVTGTVSVGNTIRIEGITGGLEVGITGGRRLSSSSDSVTVSGTVGITGGRYLLPGYDGVRIYGGNNGETMIPVTIRDGSGNSIGSSGGALNVNLVGSGFTATVSVGAIVGICQANQAIPLFVAGATTGPAVRVKGLGTNDAVPVVFEGSNSVSVSGPVTVDLNETITRLDTISTNTAVISTVNTNTQNIYNKINSGDGVNTRPIKPGQVYYGSLTVGPSTTAVTFEESTVLYSGVTIKAAISNGTKDVLISGNAAGAAGPDAGFPLSAGQTIFIETNNLQNLFFENWTGSGTLKIHYIAS